MNFIYVIWAVISILVWQTGDFRYNFLKYFSFTIYSVIASFYMSQAIPEIYNYYVDLWAVLYLEHQAKQGNVIISDNDEEEFNEDETLVSPDD